MHLLLSVVLLAGCHTQNEPSAEASDVPEFMSGSFVDDYGVTYTITDSTFMMEDHTLIHISEWNTKDQFFIGQNDSANQYDPLLYSRIDWMEFEDMGAFTWGFCMSAYNAPTADSASSVHSPDRSNPKVGCNGYPFSRMKSSN